MNIIFNVYGMNVNMLVRWDYACVQSLLGACNDVCMRFGMTGNGYVLISMAHQKVDLQPLMAARRDLPGRDRRC